MVGTKPVFYPEGDGISQFWRNFRYGLTHGPLTQVRIENLPAHFHSEMYISILLMDKFEWFSIISIFGWRFGCILGCAGAESGVKYVVSKFVPTKAHITSINWMLARSPFKINLNTFTVMSFPCFAVCMFGLLIFITSWKKSLTWSRSSGSILIEICASITILIKKAVYDFT